MNVSILHRKRAVLSVLLILLFSLAGMTNVFAHDFEVDNLLYTITSTDPPTVSLDGHVDGTSASDELLIPETVDYDGVTYTVTAIGNSAFADCLDMYGDIVIPNTVIVIGDHAFDNAGFDGEVTIGTSVATIGGYAFTNCSNLYGDLVIPNSVTQMGDHAFFHSGFTGMLTIGTALTEIADYAFAECSYLTGALTIPNSVTRIGNYAFDGCSGFDGAFSLSTAVTEIGNYAFRNCGNMTKNGVSLPSTLTNIGDYAFANCTQLTGVLTIPKSVVTIGASAFLSCTGFTRLTMSNSQPALTTIGDYAFYGCNHMTGNLAIPTSVISIGYGAFRFCAFDGNLQLRNVQTIGAWAFTNVPFNDRGLTIPASVISIGEYAFNGCFQQGEQSTLTINSTQLTEIPAGAFGGTGLTGTLNLPSSITTIGESAFSSSHFSGSLSLPTALTSIGSNAFSSCTSFTGTLTIPENVTTIGNNAFYGCSGFTQLNYNAANCNIESSSNWLSGCTNISTLHIGNTVQTIPMYAFYSDDFELVGDLDIPASVTTIGNYAFSGHEGLTSVTFHEGLTRISGYAFENCTGLTSIELPQSLTFMSGFYGCTGLTSVTVPENAEGIGNSAFQNCSNLSELHFNATNCTTINSSGGVFWLYGCDALTTLTFGENVQSIPDDAFMDCNALTGDLALPNALVSIGDNAFYNAGFNGNLTLGENLTSIGEWSFSNSRFGSITIHAEVPPTIGGYAFNRTDKNINVYVPCGSEEDYANAAWGGFNTFEGMCSGTITVAANPAEYGSVTGGGYFEGGQTCTVVATPNAGYAFANWKANGTLVSTSAEYTFPVTGDMDLVAQFVTEGNIVFADANVKSICVSNWDSNNDGELSYAEAASVSNLGYSFHSTENITSFDELQYFIGLSVIDSYAFRNCSNLTSVTFPEGITAIGDYAFDYCRNLTSVTFPEGITTIGEYAFNYCSSLTGDLAFPNSLTTIKREAFYSCSSLNGSLTIGENVTYIGDNVFDHCGFTTLNYNAIDCTIDDGSNDWTAYLNNLTTLNIGENVEVIPAYAFRDKSSLTGTLTIPESVTFIGQNAFSYCGFTAIHFNATNCQSVGYDPENGNYEYAFYNNTALTSIVIGDNVTQIPSYAFANIYSTQCTVDLGNGVTRINDNAFLNENGMANYSIKGTLTLPASLTYIGDRAFYLCGGLTGELVIPESVTSIGVGAFSYCTGFTGNLVIPEALAIIGDNAFYNCQGFESFTVMSAVPPTIGANTFYAGPHYVGNVYYNSNYEKPLYIPCGTMATYQAAENWSNFTNMQYADVTTEMVYEGLQYEIIDTENHYLKLMGFATADGAAENLVIPANIVGECDGYTYSVTEIADEAFMENLNLTGTLTLPASLTKIGNSAFDGCESLNGTLVIPENVTWIGRWTFFACEFTAIHYNATDCGSIGYTEDNELGTSFLWNNMLEEIVIGDNVTQIPAYAFAYTHSQNCQLTLGNSVETIGNYAFCNVNDNSAGLSGTLAIPASVTHIGHNAFAYNYNLTGDLVIPENMNKIGKEAFIYCGFTSIHYNATDCESIGMNDSGTWNFAFWNCNKLGEIVIGDNVSQIPIYAFANTGTQYNLVLGNGVTTINNWAFNGSNSAANTGVKGALVIPNSVTYIGYGAFYNASGMTEIWCKRPTAPTIQNNTFYNVDKSIPVHVPCGSRSNYQNATHWSAFTNYAENPYFLVVTANDELLGTATVTQLGDCTDNTSTVHAEPYEGSAFLNWTTPDGTEVVTTTDYTFALTEDMRLMAHFVQLEGHHNFVGGGSDFNWDNVDNWVPKQLPTATSTVGIWADATVSGDVEVASATLHGDAWVYVNPDASLRVTDELSTADESLIYLNEGGQLYHSNDDVRANVQRVITPYTVGEKDGWHLIASPLADDAETSQVTNLTSNEYDLYYYDEPTVYWINQEDAGNEFNTIENGKGYLYGNNGIVSHTAQSQVGEDSYNSTSFYPMATQYYYSISELLFRASEFTAAGVGTNPIQSISWYSNGYEYELSDITIWMANVDDEEITRTTHNTSSMQLVFSGGCTSKDNDWTEFVFNQGSFAWDGTSNVLVCVQNNGNPTTYNIGWRLSYDLGFTAVNYYYNSNTPYDMSNNIYNYVYQATRRPITLFKTGKASRPFEAQVGEGNLEQGNYPMHSFWKYSISEQLYKADELQTAGVGQLINSLGWYATAVGSVPTQYGISIYMANVSDNALTTTSHKTNNMTLVYYGSFTPQVGWNEFDFNWNDFEWDGTSNVLVCVQRNNGNYASGLIWQTHATSFNASSYVCNDNNSYNMLSNTYSTTVATQRANTIFKCAARNVSLVFSGEIQNGTAQVTIPLSYTAGPRLAGFNLVGNPYAHNVTSYTSVNVANGCYRMNETKDDLIVSEISETNPLKPTEGFFVKATDADASVTFNAQRGEAIANTSSFRVEINHENKIVDRLIVKDAEAQPLEKFSLNERRTKVYAQGENQELAIVPCEGNEQPVSFKAAIDGSYTLNVFTDNMEFDYLHLIDNLTGEDVDLLAEPTYTFEARTSDYASRFRLVFLPKTVTGTEQESFAYCFNGKFVIANEGEATLQVVDVLGHILSSESINGTCEKQINAAPGVYMLRLLNGDKIKTQKIVINN